MSDEHATTATDGETTVERSIEMKQKGLIVTLSVRTEADRETAVRVTDDLPARVEPNEVGFHPDRAPADGTATPDGVVFAGEVTRDEPLTVAYGAYFDTTTMAVDPADASLHVDATTRVPDRGSSGGLFGFLGGLFGGGSDEEPEVPDDRAGGAPETDSFAQLEGDDGASGDTSDADADEASDESPAVDPEPTPAVTEVEPATDGSGADDAATGMQAAEPAVTRVAEPAVTETDADESAPDEESPTEETDADEEPGAGDDGAPGSLPEGSVAAALAAELAAGEVDEETRETLAAELETELTGSQLARLDRVQRRTDDLRAYVEPLKDFLDEEGRPTEVVADLRGELRAARGEIEGVREEVAGVSDDLTQVREEVREEVNDELAALSEELDRLDRAVADAAAERDAISDELDGATAQLARSREELADDIETVRDDLTAELERAERQAREGRRDIEADIDKLRQVATQVESLREALSTAFDIGSGAALDADSEAADDGPASDEADSTDIEAGVREVETEEDEEPSFEL